MTRDEIEDISKRSAGDAVHATLLSIGIDIENPIEAQRDFAILREVGKLVMSDEFRRDIEHTRRWRKMMEGVQSKGLMVTVGSIATGLIALVLIGVQNFFGKH